MLCVESIQNDQEEDDENAMEETLLEEICIELPGPLEKKTTSKSNNLFSFVRDVRVVGP